MAGAAVRESATFAGRADQVREAPAFVGRLLGSSHPCRDVAVLQVSEMVTNSLLHGGSAGPGETDCEAITMAATGDLAAAEGPGGHEEGRRVQRAGCR
jgi:hypothetical protein